MKILLDIDDTLSITAPLWTQMTEQYMREHCFPRKRQKDSYYIEKSFTLNESQRQAYYRDMISDFPYGGLSTVPGAITFVNHHLQKGDEIEFITARPMLKYSETTSWLKTHFGIQNPIVNYKNYVGSLSADLLIDNSLQRIRNAVERGIIGILFTGVQIERNEKDSLQGIQKAKTFGQIERILKEIYENGRKEDALRGEIKLSRQRRKS